MILWTIQTEPAVRRMERTGALRGDRRRVWPELRHAYQWMNEQIRKRLGSPPRGSRYPVWAWKVYDSDSPRPDLRRAAHLPQGTRGARLEIDVPEERVLLSDFLRWHSVLNGLFLYDDMREDEEMERQEVWRYPERVRESWPRIFELDRGDPAEFGEPSQRSIQATLWAVYWSEVRDITWFTAR